MQAIRTRQIEANGLSFAIDEAGEGDSVALLLHGFPESRRSWRAQLSALAQLGWRAVAPDLRGYGGTSRPAGRAAYGLDHLTADVGALFDSLDHDEFGLNQSKFMNVNDSKELKRDAGGKPLRTFPHPALGARRRLLIAHDWGGIIAWVFAIEKVRPLDGLVILNAPHPAAYLEHLRGHPAQWLKSWYVLFFQLPWLPEALTTAVDARAVRRAFSGAAANSAPFSPELLDHYAEAARAPGAMTAMINYYRANALGLRRWGSGRVAPIDVPTLVIWGEQDPFLGVGLSDPGPAYVKDLTVERLAGAGHWVQQEDAEGVNQRLAAWLEARKLSRPA